MKNHYKEIRKRVAINVGTKLKTDQSYKKMCDINAIVQNYQKTGVLSHQKQKIAQYIDNTQIPSLMDAQALLRDAKEAFLGLPSDIRKLMDHDPTKLVEFVQNPNNGDLLLKHGIIEKKEPKKQDVSEVPPTAKPAVEQAQEE